MTSQIQELLDDIADLELSRDTADKERECFAVRKAKEADELREKITKLQAVMKDVYYRHRQYFTSELVCRIEALAATEGKDE